MWQLYNYTTQEMFMSVLFHKKENTTIIIGADSRRAAGKMPRYQRHNRGKVSFLQRVSIALAMQSAVLAMIDSVWPSVW